MRSLFVTDSKIWTAETEYAVEVARAESALGWDVTVAAPAESAALNAVAGELPAAELPGADPARSPADMLADVRFVADVVSETRPDVVHSSRSAPHLLCALAVGRRAALVHLRGGAQRPRENAANRFLYGRMTDAVVVSSRRIAAWLTDGLSVPGERVHRLLAPVDVDRFAAGSGGAEIRASLGVAAGAPLVVNVARLSPVKGQHVLVKAMADVVARRPDAVLVLVGEPWSGEPEGLLGLSERLGIGGSVVAVGRRDDVPSILAEADVCVSSSVGSEENSRAVSEYVAAGRPVVATRVGVVPELIEDGATGLLVAPDDAPAMAAAVLDLLDDCARASRFATQASSFARRELSRSAFVERIGAVLEGVKDRRGAAGRRREEVGG